MHNPGKGGFYEQPQYWKWKGQTAFNWIKGLVYNKQLLQKINVNLLFSHRQKECANNRLSHLVLQSESIVGKTGINLCGILSNLLCRMELEFCQRSKYTIKINNVEMRKPIKAFNFGKPSATLYNVRRFIKCVIGSGTGL